MDTFTALAEPTRRRIVELLGGGERAAGEITAQFAASPPAISQHLKVLREARLVRVRPEGQRRIYSLEPSGWAELDVWVLRMRRFWSARLDALERQLAQSSPTAERGESE
jgi:DNA-binding transcriptional ArsR family regulator